MLGILTSSILNINRSIPIYINFFNEFYAILCFRKVKVIQSAIRVI